METTTPATTVIPSPSSAEKSREYELLLAYLSSPPDCIRELLDQIDWDRFQSLADYHRVGPAISFRTAEMRPELRPANFSVLCHQSLEISKQNQEQWAELGRVLDAFVSRSIKVVPFKGVALSYQLYSDWSVRPSSDIDLFVRSADVLRAMDCLSELGYRSGENISNEHMRSRVPVDIEHYLVFNNFGVDLHWGILPRWYGELSTDRFVNESEPKTLGERDVMVFRPEHHVLLLSLHAAKHFCDKLLWPLDIVHLVSQEENLDWNEIVEIATRARMEQHLFLTLAVCINFLGLRLPENLLARIHDESCISEVLPEIAHAHATAFSLEYSPRAVHWKIRFASGARGRARFLMSMLFSPTIADIQFIDLPAPLRFLYTPIRISRLIGKFVARMLGIQQPKEAE